MTDEDQKAFEDAHQTDLRPNGYLESLMGKYTEAATVDFAGRTVKIVLSSFCGHSKEGVWVDVIDVGAKHCIGVVNNIILSPAIATRYQLGDTIAFTTDQIIQLWEEPTATE